MEEEHLPDVGGGRRVEGGGRGRRVEGGGRRVEGGGRREEGGRRENRTLEGDQVMVGAREGSR
jgi:hypothetical protein